MSNETTTALAPTGAALISQLKEELIAEENRLRELKLSGKKGGAVTGFNKLDSATGGFLSEGLHTLLAAPGAGKTAFALQIAAQCECPALFITSEMPRLELMRRIISRTTKTFCSKLSGGTLSSDELQDLIENTEAAAPMLALMDATMEAVPATRILETAQDLKARFDADHILVVIDSVTDWALSVAFADPTASPTEYQAIESGLTSLKRVSAHLQAPVLCIAHKNRNSQSKGGDESLFSGKGTGRFEYLSESVWSLDTTETAQSPRDITPVVLTLAKNRRGQKGLKFSFDFEGRIMEFRLTGGLL